MLFTTTAQIREFFPLEKNMDFNVLKPFLQTAEDTYIKRILGQDQLANLQAAFDANSYTTAQTNLLKEVRKPLALMAMYLAVPNINLRWSDMGLMKSLSNDFENASGGEVYFARTQLLIDGYRGLDNLYRFLETNKATYTIWAGSSAYSEYSGYLLTNAEAFGKHVKEAENRWLFVHLVPEMDMVQELRIKPALGDDFFTELVELTNPSDEETILLGWLQKATALFTYAQALNNPQVREMLRITNAQTADELSRKSTTESNLAAVYAQRADDLNNAAGALMAKAVKYLNANASGSVFATYYNSELYVDPTTANKTSRYNNDSSQTSFALI